MVCVCVRGVCVCVLCFFHRLIRLCVFHLGAHTPSVAPHYSVVLVLSDGSAGVTQEGEYTERGYFLRLVVAVPSCPLVNSSNVDVCVIVYCCFLTSLS